MHRPTTRRALCRAAYLRRSVTDSSVVWSFGNQRITTSDRDDRRFDFGVQFIARIDNIVAESGRRSLSVMAVTTRKRMSRYADEIGNNVVIDFDAAEVIVSEPLLELTKEFAVETADASDQVTVTITATNNGTAPAYNPRFLDDLTGTGLSYIGNVAGTNPTDQYRHDDLRPRQPAVQL